MDGGLILTFGIETVIDVAELGVSMGQKGVQDCSASHLQKENLLLLWCVPVNAVVVLSHVVTFVTRMLRDLSEQYAVTVVFKIHMPK